MQTHQIKTETKIRFAKNGLIFAIGGSAYMLLECLWRGYSHWTMFCLGGACFRLIGAIGQVRLPRIFRCGLCAAGVTAAELLCGCVVNLWWHMDVWDYSRRPFNVLGQICPLYTLLWGLLSLPVMSLYKVLAQSLRLGQTSTSGQSAQRGFLAEHISRPK
ncbi:MAG: hypothetical protein ACI39E_03205 [Acutalibacteraceae bacterium]